MQFYAGEGTGMANLTQLENDLREGRSQVRVENTGQNIKVSIPFNHDESLLLALAPDSDTLIKLFEGLGRPFIVKYVKELLEP
jgi:hypothetical protein